MLSDSATKDRPFGVAGQPHGADLFSDRAEIDPGQDPSDVITHPMGAMEVAYNQRKSQLNGAVDDTILGSPAKFSAQRLGYKGMKS